MLPPNYRSFTTSIGQRASCWENHAPPIEFPTFKGRKHGEKVDKGAANAVWFAQNVPETTTTWWKVS
jgi:hypothetical protein